MPLLFLRNGFIVSQLDGEGQRIMDQQRQMHIKEPVKENLLKHTAATKRVNVSALRNSSNVETQTNRINNMLRPTVTQGIGEGNVNETTHFCIGEENEKENRASPADPHVFIGEESRASPADTTHDVKVEEFTLETFLEQQRFGLRSQKMFKISAEIEAEHLQQQEQSYRAEANQALDKQQRAHRAEVNQALDKQQRAHRAEAEQALDKQRRSHRSEAEQDIHKTENRVKQEAEMRHRGILKHKEQQAAYLTKKSRYLIAERRQANRTTQHSKEHTFENTNKKNNKEPGKNLADGTTFQAGGPKTKGKNTGHSDTPGTTAPPKATPGVKKTINKPKHDTEKDTSMSKTHGRKTTIGHVTEQLFKRGWKWSKTPDGKNAKLKRPELQQIVIDVLGIN